MILPVSHNLSFIPDCIGPSFSLSLTHTIVQVCYLPSCIYIIMTSDLLSVCYFLHPFYLFSVSLFRLLSFSPLFLVLLLLSSSFFLLFIFHSPFKEGTNAPNGLRLQRLVDASFVGITEATVPEQTVEKKLTISSSNMKRRRSTGC